MTSYLIKKMVSLAAVLFLVSLTVFSVLFVLPGDPAQIILGINASPETLAALRARLGLDQPFWAQYGSWIGSLLQGTGGHSITYDMAVFELIGSRLAVTGPLALMAMVIAVVLALPLGIFAARHQNRPADAAVMAGTQLGLAVPEFWLGILLMLLFSVQWGMFSAGGFPGWDEDVWGSLKALFLPALALGLIRTAILTRLTRSSMLEVLREDYVRTARAKGLKEHTRGLRPRPEKRTDPGADHFGSANGAAAGWGHHHRKCILPARIGATGVPGHRPAGPARGAGGGSLHGGGCCGRQLSRGPLLRGR